MDPAVLGATRSFRAQTNNSYYLMNVTNFKVQKEEIVYAAV
jgi:hypothetical protein